MKYVYDRGLMTGLNENDFGAVQSLARAQFAVILYRMEGEPEVEYKDVFPDVADGQWYTDANLQMKQCSGQSEQELFPVRMREQESTRREMRRVQNVRRSSRDL